VFVLFVFRHDVHDEVYFLFAFVGAIRTLELRLFAALPSPVVVQGAFALVSSSTVITNKRAGI
jgi:hypothetical protein